MTVVTCPDASSESCDDDDLLCARAAVEVWVNLEVCGIFFPMVPIFFSCFIIVSHDPIANGFPRRQDITLYASFLGIWYSFHEQFCIGKREENVVMNGLLDFVNAVSLKERDAASAILLSFPALWIVCNGPVLLM